MEITEQDILMLISKAAVVALKSWPTFNTSDDPVEILLTIQHAMNRMMIMSVPPGQIEETATGILSLHIIACLVSRERLRREAALKAVLEK